jgi:RNA polymerase sigma-70 factor (ECF subfamily)
VVRFRAEPIEDDEWLSDEPSPPMHAIAAEDAGRLRELVAALPRQQRELIKLKVEAGLSYKEMAEALRTSVSTVGVQLHDAIKTLRRQWPNENQGMMTT